MADIKKYYYMRLKENFFESEELVMLEAMTEGMLYSNILIKLYLKSLKNEGRLMFKDTIPYNAQMIATITRHQIGTVEKALIIFGDLGLIEVLDNGMIYMNDIELFIGKTTTEAERKKKARMAIENEKKALIGQMSDKCPNSNGQMSDKYPPENRVKSLESRVKSLETDNIPSKEVSQSVNDLDIHFKLAQNFYDDNIGNATPFICERIGYMVDENDHELVLEAMKLTVIAKPTRAVTYIESILKNWKKDRITNLKQLVLHQQVKEAKPSGLNNQSRERPSDNEYDGLSI